MTDLRTWIVNDTEYNDLDKATDAVVDSVDEDVFEDHLSMIYGDVNVCGYNYDAGRVLKEIDPIAFRVAFNDLTSNLYEEIYFDLDRMDKGDKLEIYDVTVEMPWEEEPEDDEDKGDSEDDDA